MASRHRLPASRLRRLSDHRTDRLSGQLADYHLCQTDRQARLLLDSWHQQIRDIQAHLTPDLPDILQVHGRHLHVQQVQVRHHARTGHRRREDARHPQLAGHGKADRALSDHSARSAAGPHYMDRFPTIISGVTP